MLTMSTEPCPCGRPFRLIAKVEGRSDDIIYLQTPQGQMVPVHSINFDNAIGVLHEIREYYVVHEVDGINIIVVLREGASYEEMANRLKTNLRETLESLGTKCPEIRVRLADRIERDPSMMGKLKRIRSNVGRGQIRNE